MGRQERLHRARFAACVLFGALAYAPPGMADPSPCEGARVVSDTTELDPSWREALSSLVAATAREGQPWSCTGASLRLRVDESGAELIVQERDGRVVRRIIASPDELVAAGEALLARPFTSTVQPIDLVSPRPPVIAEPRGTVIVAGEPRLLADALLGTRITGPASTLWASATGRGTLPFESWGVALWGRADLPLTNIEKQKPSQEVTEACLGFGVMRRVVNTRFALLASLDPSVAIVSMEEPRPRDEFHRGDPHPPHPGGARAELRIGLSARATYRLTPSLRLLGVVDGEIAPSDAVSPVHITSMLPPLPAYTCGLSVGVEAVIR